jgi:hypothetical protein
MAPVPKFARYASISSALLMTVISWLAYVGIYRWVAEAQLALMQQFEMHLTFLITVLGYAALFAVAARFMVSLKLLPRATPEETAKYLADAAAIHTGRVKPLILIWAILPWAIAGLVCGGYARYASSIEKPTVVTMAEIDGGNSPSATWLEVSGFIPEDCHVEYGDQYHPDYYTPMLTPSWDPAKPVMVMIRSNGKLQTGLNSFKGMRWPLGVPGPVRAIFQRSGVNAEEAILLENGDLPSDWRLPGTLMIAGGGIGMAICGVSFYFSRRDRASSAQTHPPIEARAQPEDIHSA